jgi:hypothetical protein
VNLPKLESDQWHVSDYELSPFSAWLRCKHQKLRFEASQMLSNTDCASKIICEESIRERILTYLTSLGVEWTDRALVTPFSDSIIITTLNQYRDAIKFVKSSPVLHQNNCFILIMIPFDALVDPNLFSDIRMLDNNLTFENCQLLDGLSF